MKFLLINSVCGMHSTGRICTDILADSDHECRIDYGEKYP